MRKQPHPLTDRDREAIRKGVQAAKEGRVTPADTFFDWMRAKYVRDIWDAQVERLTEESEALSRLQERFNEVWDERCNLLKERDDAHRQLADGTVVRREGRSVSTIGDKLSSITSRLVQLNELLAQRLSQSAEDTSTGLELQEIDNMLRDLIELEKGG